MKNKLKLDIIGLISSVLVACLCVAAIVIAIISELNAGLIVAIVMPYAIIIGGCLYFAWEFIDAIFKESEEEAKAIMKDTAIELLNKDEEIKQLKAKLEKANVLHQKRKR